MQNLMVWIVSDLEITSKDVISAPYTVITVSFIHSSIWENKLSERQQRNQGYTL